MLAVIWPCELSSRLQLKSSVVKLVKLGLTVITVTLVSFGPFMAHLPQLAARLFPVARGLTHSYWAGNVWALYRFVNFNINVKIVIYAYSTLDLALSKILPRLGMAVPPSHVTGGVVGGASFSVLPEVSPVCCMALMLVSILPMLLRVWREPCGNELEGYTICALASFLFGYHVHEKAILLVILPFTALGKLNSKR